MVHRVGARTRRANFDDPCRSSRIFRSFRLKSNSSFFVAVRQSTAKNTYTNTKKVMSQTSGHNGHYLTSCLETAGFLIFARLRQMRRREQQRAKRSFFALLLSLFCMVLAAVTVVLFVVLFTIKQTFPFDII